MPDPGLFSLVESYSRQSDNVFKHVIQQKESRFMGMQDANARWTGKEFIFRDLSKNNWTRNDSRGGDTMGRESQTSFRKVYKKKVEPEAIWFYEWDKELLDNVVLPTSEEMQAMDYGFQRIYDDLSIEAAFEDSYGGVEPYNTAQVFPTSQVVPVNYGTPQAPTALSDLGMTPWKLTRANAMFDKLDLDMENEEKCIALSPDEIDDLVYYSSTFSQSFWGQVVGEWVKEWNKGNRAAQLMGFRVIKTNRLTVASGVRSCIAFCRSGFVKSATTDIKMTIDRIPEKKNALLLQGSAMVGIGRRYDEKVIKIPCYHA